MSRPIDPVVGGQAKVDADAAYAKLVADPTQFDTIARAESDEESARGASGSGGVLPSYVSADSTYVETFSKPILDAKAKDDQILPPIKTEFGYHIVQILNHAPDSSEKVKAEIDGGADFGRSRARPLKVPRRAPAATSAGSPRASSRTTVIAGIFDAPIGKRLEPCSSSRTTASYLFRSSPRRTRTPEGRQLDQIKARAFSDWYTLKKEAVPVTRDPAITGAGAAG